MSKYLLDTNVCVAAMRQHPAVLARLSATVPGDCAISTISAFEILTGVEKCAQPASERAKVARLMELISLVPFDELAAAEAARIRADLESRGQAIGPYDTLLAGHAASLQLTLVTNNTREFTRIVGLSVENWQTPTS